MMRGILDETYKVVDRIRKIDKKKNFELTQIENYIRDMRTTNEVLWTIYYVNDKYRMQPLAIYLTEREANLNAACFRLHQPNQSMHVCESLHTSKEIKYLGECMITYYCNANKIRSSILIFLGIQKYRNTKIGGGKDTSRMIAEQVWNSRLGFRQLLF